MMWQVLYMGSIQQVTKTFKKPQTQKSKDYKRAAKYLQEWELHRQFVKSGTTEENRDTNKLISWSSAGSDRSCVWSIIVVKHKKITNIISMGNGKNWDNTNYPDILVGNDKTDMVVLTDEWCSWCGQYVQWILCEFGTRIINMITVKMLLILSWAKWLTSLTYHFLIKWS